VHGQKEATCLQRQPHRTYRCRCSFLAIERGFQRAEVELIGVPCAKVIRVQTHGKLGC
jgi:hypothetical protein